MSVGSPTRVWIMTGQNAARHRTTNWINPSNNNAGEIRCTGLELDRIERERCDTAEDSHQRRIDPIRIAVITSCSILAEDPFEQTNRAETEPAILGRMMNELIAQLETYQAIYCVGQKWEGTAAPIAVVQLENWQRASIILTFRTSAFQCPRFLLPRF